MRPDFDLLAHRPSHPDNKKQIDPEIPDIELWSKASDFDFDSNIDCDYDIRS